jgi:hypothetical protein
MLPYPASPSTPRFSGVAPHGPDRRLFYDAIRSLRFPFTNSAFRTLMTAFLDIHPTFPGVETHFAFPAPAWYSFFRSWLASENIRSSRSSKMERESSSAGAKQPTPLLYLVFSPRSIILRSYGLLPLHSRD